MERHRPPGLLAILRSVSPGPTDDDAKFLERVVSRLADLEGVRGVAIGGSRARGRARPDSDWDLGIFLADGFSPDAVRAVVADGGWSGLVAELGEWGPVMNGGAWLQIEDRRVDLLWRELATLERLADEADRGEFSVVRIPFFVAGIPSYVPLGELSVNWPLWGAVPPGRDMPEALRRHGTAWWTENARLDLDYCRGLAARGDLTVASGLLSRGLIEVAHARMCAAGRWVLNEKDLLGDAGLDDVLGPSWTAPGGPSFDELVDQAAALLPGA
jgi:Nucleotidyltransferase domain